MRELTNNQYYKGLNNRFDNRCKKLRKLGYKYNKDKAGYTYGNMPSSLIHNAVIMHSDKRHFITLIRA